MVYIFEDQLFMARNNEQSFLSQKVGFQKWCPFIFFVYFNGHHFSDFNRIYKKEQCGKRIFFSFPTLIWPSYKIKTKVSKFQKHLLQLELIYIHTQRSDIDRIRTVHKCVFIVSNDILRKHIFCDICYWNQQH